MSMLDVSALRLVFRARLDTLVGIPAAAYRSWANREFEPPVDATWLRETLQVIYEEKSSTGYIEAFGRITYDVFSPIGVGSEIPEAVALVIAEGFEAGQSLQDGSLHVSIENTERGAGAVGGGDEGSWFQIPVVTEWRVFTPSST